MSDIAAALSLIRAAAAAEPVGAPFQIPATVTGYDPVTYIATVTLDDGASLAVKCLIGDVASGDRVRVEFIKPHGVFVVANEAATPIPSPSPADLGRGFATFMS